MERNGSPKFPLNNALAQQFWSQKLLKKTQQCAQGVSPTLEKGGRGLNDDITDETLGLR